jgi:hypothetical protein
MIAFMNILTPEREVAMGPTTEQIESCPDAELTTPA